jgi:hypothetical protein
MPTGRVSSSSWRTSDYSAHVLWLILGTASHMPRKSADPTGSFLCSSLSIRLVQESPISSRTSGVAPEFAACSELLLRLCREVSSWEASVRGITRPNRSR